MANYNLVCPFLTDDPLFAFGCEFGMLYAELKDRPRTIKNYFTIENQEQILLLANRLGYHVVKMKPWGDQWFFLKLRRRDTLQKETKA